MTSALALWDSLFPLCGRRGCHANPPKKKRRRAIRDCLSASLITGESLASGPRLPNPLRLQPTDRLLKPDKVVQSASRAQRLPAGLTAAALMRTRLFSKPILSLRAGSL